MRIQSVGNRFRFIAILSQDRLNRPKNTSSETADCPLCINALGSERVKDISDRFSLTENRYKAIAREHLLVSRSHSPFKLDDIADWVRFSQNENCSVLFSSYSQSVPSHSHASVTDIFLPIVKAVRIQIQDNLYVTEGYPARSYVVLGDFDARVETANKILKRLIVFGIHYNLVITDGQIIIHPLRESSILEIKKIGARETAGIFSTGRKELYLRLISDPYFSSFVLQKSSFSSSEMKAFLADSFYSYSEFAADFAVVAEKLKQWRKTKKVGKMNKCHILGVTRGGMMMAAMLHKNLPNTSISLAGCFFNSREEVVWKTHVGRFTESQVILTTDLLRSGKIIRAIIQKIREVNPHVKNIVVVGSHSFSNIFLGEVDLIFAHQVPYSQFILYPWERAGISVENNWLTSFHRSMIKESKKISPRGPQYGTDVMYGLGVTGIMATSILSQYLNITNTIGLDEDNLTREYITSVASDSLDRRIIWVGQKSAIAKVKRIFGVRSEHCFVAVTDAGSYPRSV